jgi:arylsulfatase
MFICITSTTCLSAAFARQLNKRLATNGRFPTRKQQHATVLHFFFASCLVAPTQAHDILSFPPTPSASQAGVTIESSTYRKRVEPKRLPEGAPNIVIILIDDVGPGTPSTYGGEINTPTLSRIAGLGVSYNRFHSTAKCSPTRAALLTGRNHTPVGNGQIAAIANDFDGFSGIIPKCSATMAEVLKAYGYNTAAFGKWHNTP